jgi:hypothetical protein
MLLKPAVDSSTAEEQNNCYGDAAKGGSRVRCNPTDICVCQATDLQDFSVSAHTLSTRTQLYIQTRIKLNECCRSTLVTPPADGSAVTTKLLLRLSSSLQLLLHTQICWLC